ncbi:MAG: response regulator [Verrucomicrobiota bacterium]
MESAPASTNGSPGKEGLLLLVDDNELNRERLAGRLQRQGYRVLTVAGGEQALQKITEEPVDLVLLDSMMPGLSGQEVLRAIKEAPTTQDIPVIMISGLDEIDSVAHYIEMGAADYLPSPFDPVLLMTRIDSCLENKRLREKEAQFLKELQREMEHSDRLVNVVIPIGITLMREPDFNRLLEKILLEAKSICHADGGTLYLRTEDDGLKFVMLRNDSLHISMGGTSGKPIPFPPLRLYDPQTKEPNHSQVACHVALTGASVNIPDAYHAEGFDFKGTREFDRRTGYRSASFLTVPLRNQRDEVIGVLQLINAQDPKTGQIIPFDPILQQSVESLSLLAAAALESYHRVHSTAG